MPEIKADLVVDTRGQTCPMPVLNTKRGLARLLPGQVMEVLATDFGSESDIGALVQRLGHTIVQIDRSEKLCRFFIRRA
ncbi:MAG: sulfurtransferase TusA family protein [Candidatus Methylomirabilia bacterium]